MDPIHTDVIGQKSVLIGGLLHCPNTVINAAITFIALYKNMTCFMELIILTSTVNEVRPV